MSLTPTITNHNLSVFGVHFLAVVAKQTRVHIDRHTCKLINALMHQLSALVARIFIKPFCIGCLICECLQVDERLDASVKRILTANRRMAEELKIHVQETEVLQQEVKILEEERSRLMREVALKTELEEGYAKRGAQQSQALKTATAKISALESSLAQVSLLDSLNC